MRRVTCGSRLVSSRHCFFSILVLLVLFSFGRRPASFVVSIVLSFSLSLSLSHA